MRNICAQGKTTEKKNDKAPIWNEELVFYDAYPPLWQRMRVQLWDSDRVSSSLIATHVLDLSTISSPGEMQKDSVVQ
jgi:Ca2+-dependent lipid-binding protein